MKPFNLLTLLVFLLTVVACNKKQTEMEEAPYVLTEYILDEPPLIGQAFGMDFFEGGFSDLHCLNAKDSIFMTVTDRGPNLPFGPDSTTQWKSVKIFPFPDYSPKVVFLQIKNGRLQWQKSLSFMDSSGMQFNGLPSYSLDSKGEEEAAWLDKQGTPAVQKGIGMDAEGLSLNAAGDVMWIGEEYQPALFSFNARTGVLRSSYLPGKGLPKISELRRPNRGFEALCHGADGSLYAVFQSPLASVLDSGEANRLVRLYKIDDAGTVQVWLLETDEVKAPLRQKDVKISAAHMLPNGQMLYLEAAEHQQNKTRNLYLLDLKSGSPLRDPEMDEARFGNAKSALKEGIKIPTKKLILDLESIPELSGIEKIEGMTLLDKHTLALISDNDFDIGGSGDKSRLFLLRFKTPLISE